MAITTIILKHSETIDKVPILDDLTVGEIALNTAQGKLYYRNTDSSPEDIESISYLDLEGGTLTGNLKLLDELNLYFGDDESAVIAYSAFGNQLYIGADGASDSMYISATDTLEIYAGTSITLTTPALYGNFITNTIIQVTSLPASPLNTIYELTVSGSYYPRGYYLHNGFGWLCIQQREAYLITAGATLNATLISGVIYDMTTTQNITDLSIDINTYGSVIINTDNSGGYTIVDPTALNSPTNMYKRTSTGLDDIAAEFAEIVITKSPSGLNFSAVELITL